MKECKTFFKKINNCLNHKLKPNSDLFEHMETCKKCSDFYNSYINTTADFKVAMHKEISKLPDFDFNFINMEEYNNKKVNVNFRRTFLKTALIASSVIIIFITAFTAFNLFNRNGNYIALNINNNEHLSNFFNESYIDNSNNADVNVYDIEWFSYSDVPEMNFDELFF